MAEPLKNIYDSNYIETLGVSLKNVEPLFDDKSFQVQIFNFQWQGYELKQRASHICRCIHEELAVKARLSFQQICEILKVAGEDFGGYAGLFFPEYIERYGLEHWEISMDALEVLTEFSSAEFAIRPFIERYPEQTMSKMLSWSQHENHHVRRLSSEGCRPRLPWASALKEFKKNPSSILPILENLKNDSSLYVRKSVANNLNDISKDHPELALKIGKAWLKGSSKETQWIVKHGLRTLLKASHQEALSLFGLAELEGLQFNHFKLHTPFLGMGERLSFQFDLQLERKSLVRIEYALHFKKKSGDYGRKVFKLSEMELDKGEYEVTKEHLFKEISTRVYYQGVHFLEIIINGKTFHKEPFFLSLTLNQVSHSYYIYMIYTSKNTIYTGVTTEPARRFQEHLTGKKGAKYTKVFNPLAFIHLEGAEDRSSAQKRESALKKLSRHQKESLSGHKLSLLKELFNI
ncbi:MAG: DNA alkylation repair protein [Halobacteriovoraceae bacterium]|nr:DNA alkylation repair protein [Halobacteriovoraceae bacterium]